MKDRVVTASIGLKLSTIDAIQKRVESNGTTFSLEGRRIIEKALAGDKPQVAEPPAPVVIETASAPI